ncbi:MAG TPA: nucleotidyltransferase domain-containing protein [Anaerolineales bacterium]|nr:nucleotidyltransferase domain-containing protein [Anaerolineales bacterium]
MTPKDCTFPPLPPRYDIALRSAVEFIFSRFSPASLIAAGSILRGLPDPSSDLDIYVIHQEPFRQRIQKFFEGVPAEIFINPPAQVERYLAEEQAACRPITAHMLTTGFVVYGDTPLLAGLRQKAQALLDAPPAPDPIRLLWARYLAGNLYEDALDVVGRDPATAQLFLAQAVQAMLLYAFQERGLFIPRQKELLQRLEALSPELAQAARCFLTASAFEHRLQAAAQIAALTVKETGFFEWEGAPETVAP